MGYRLINTFQAKDVAWYLLAPVGILRRPTAVLDEQSRLSHIESLLKTPTVRLITADVESKFPTRSFSPMQGRPAAGSEWQSCKKGERFDGGAGERGDIGGRIVDM